MTRRRRERQSGGDAELVPFPVLARRCKRIRLGSLQPEFKRRAGTLLHPPSPPSFPASAPASSPSSFPLVLPRVFPLSSPTSSPASSPTSSRVCFPLCINTSSRQPAPKLNRFLIPPQQT
eukprot:353726-Chlamydomonas_euryale.AAC.1